MRKIIFITVLSLLILNCKNVEKKENYNTKNQIEKKGDVNKKNSTKLSDSKSTKESNVKLSRDISALKNYALIHKVNSLSFKMNDSLAKFDLEFLFEKDTKDLSTKDEIAKIFLLKLLKYQLQNANQTYDLYEEIHGVRKDKSRVIPLYYLKRNNIDTIGEFLSTGMIMEEENKKNSPYVKSLINDVNKEYKRIDSLFAKEQ